MGFSAVILAGGKASRFMGVNKARLKIGGQTIIERIYTVLEPIFDEIIIVANRPEDFKDLKPEIAVYPDMTKSCGPLSGIYTGLLKMKNEAGFFCACDMPFLDGRVIRFLLKMLAKNPDFDIVCPRTGDKYFEPLHAFYKKTCVKPVEDLLKSPYPPKVENIFPLVKTRFIDMDKVPFKTHPYVFFNVNTWESFAEAVKIDRSIQSF